jgi:hypothetical protein
MIRFLTFMSDIRISNPALKKSLDFFLNPIAKNLYLRGLPQSNSSIKKRD